MMRGHTELVTEFQPKVSCVKSKQETKANVLLTGDAELESERHETPRCDGCPAHSSPHTFPSPGVAVSGCSTVPGLSSAPVGSGAPPRPLRGARSWALRGGSVGGHSSGLGHRQPFLGGRLQPPPPPAQGSAVSAE